MATDFQQLGDFENRPDDTAFSWESEYDGPVDSEGNPDPENRDDQDFSWESTVEEPTSVITKRGANYEVTDKLNAITFIPGTACAMSEAIAYIRYWSRKGTQQKTPVGQQSQNDVPDDPQAVLDEEVTRRYIEQQELESQEQNVETDSSRTVLAVPTNTAYQSRPRQPVPVRVETVNRANSPVSGSVYSANPSGSVATVPSALPTEAVWTFLFNPEELQLSSGPDFNRAETWGVSDPANSGQPLSWRSNKNRKLTFGKILLHGYSFGKRVDSLERGLQELFTAREGDGSDGPPVLEFVWGKRVFGPCVIQNVQVREKAWDNGLLVNAEVSFELEQVPEWTINDGFVDVLRPGRQSTVNDPLVPASTPEAGATPEDEESKKNDDKKTPDGGKPVNLQECITLSKVRGDLNNLEYEIGKRLSTPLAFDRPKSGISGPVTSFPYGIPRFRFDGLIIRYAFTFLDALDVAGLDDSGNKKIRSSVVGNDCMGYNIANLQRQFKSNVDQTKSLNPSDVVKKLDNTDKFFTNKIKTCVRNVKSVLDGELKNKKCSDSPYSTPRGRLQGPGLF